MTEGEAKLAAALKPFGWTCTDDFWRRYYSDPWVFNLANAVERLSRPAEGDDEGWTRIRSDSWRLRNDFTVTPAEGDDK